MKATHRYICNAHVSVMAPPNIKLVSVAHVNNMDDLTRVRTNRLEHNVVDILLRIHGLGRVVFNDVEHDLAVEAACFIWVRCLAELALEVLPEVCRYNT